VLRYEAEANLLLAMRREEAAMDPRELEAMAARAVARKQAQQSDPAAAAAARAAAAVSHELSRIAARAGARA
jgi:hypothetical protein